MSNEDKPGTTLLGFELTPHQNALVNYLLPSITSYLLYILLFASDLCVVYRHYDDENPIWASLTLSFMYFPALGSYIVTVSSWELWPDREGCGKENVKWFVLKTAQHTLFPVWAIWRYAERIFWSIEATRSDDEKEIAAAISVVSSPRTVELYQFFQAYLQSLPQILLQVHILMTQPLDINRETVDVQVMSLVFNLSKVAATTTFYQRFKSQKLAGKQYPWFKSYKQEFDHGIDRIDGDVDLRMPLHNREVVPARPNTSSIEDNYNVEPPVFNERRRSSDFYLEPTTSFIEDKPNALRETSVVDGPQRRVFRETGVSEPDFNIRRIGYVKGLPEDDLAGKMVAFCWWFCFLLARILAISSFAYFYKTQVIWLIMGHLVIVEAFLIYDVKSDEVKRAKAVFFLFIGLIYLFCIVEFKIKFKKAKFIYYGFFTLVFLENFVMCLVWWCSDIELMESDFWFRYVFCLIAMCSVISLTSMLFYLNINKPQKIVVGTRVL